MSNTALTNRNSNEVTSLGDGNVFIKRTDSGAIKAVKSNMTLEERKGHIASIQGKCMITAAGYNELNKVASLSIITPETLTLPNGDTVVNPYPIIDKESGSISKVWVKKLAVGYSPIGNLVITSSTLLYDIQMYLIQDLMGKVQYNKNAGRICIEHSLTEQEKRTGAFYKIEGPLGIWANLNDKEILKAISTYVNNKLFAERKAQTIAERNALKKHPSLSTVYVDGQGPDKAKTAKVPVIGFTHDLNKEDLLRLSKMAEKGEEINEYKGHKVDFIDIDEIDEITEEDVIVSKDEEETVEDEPVAATQTTSSNSEEEIPMRDDKDKINIIRYINSSKKIFGETEIDKVIMDNFKKPVEQLNIKQLKMAQKLIDNIASKMDREEGVF